MGQGLSFELQVKKLKYVFSEPRPVRFFWFYFSIFCDIYFLESPPVPWVDCLSSFSASFQPNRRGFQKINGVLSKTRAPFLLLLFFGGQRKEETALRRTFITSVIRASLNAYKLNAMITVITYWTLVSNLPTEKFRYIKNKEMKTKVLRACLKRA